MESVAELILSSNQGAAALGASRAVLWLEAPLARARRSVRLTAPAQGWLIPVSDCPASARNRRERFASLRDGLPATPD